MAEFNIQSLDTLEDVEQNEDPQSASNPDQSDQQKEKDKTQADTPVKTRSQSTVKSGAQKTPVNKATTEEEEKNDAEAKEEAHIKKQMRGKALAEMMKERRRLGSVKHRRTKQQRAELILPVNDILKELKVRFPKFRVLTEASVFFTGVLENIALKIFELSGQSAKNDNRYSIKPNDIIDALENDDELYEVFDDINDRVKQILKAETGATKKKVEPQQQTKITAGISLDEDDQDFSEDEEYKASQMTAPSESTYDDESRFTAIDVDKDEQLEGQGQKKGRGRGRSRSKSQGVGQERGRSQSSKQSQDKRQGRSRSRSKSQGPGRPKSSGKRGRDRSQSSTQSQGQGRGKKRSSSPSEYSSESETDTAVTESTRYTPKRRRKTKEFKRLVDIGPRKDDNVLITQHGFFLKLTSLDQLSNILKSPYVQRLLEITKSIEQGENVENIKVSNKVSNNKPSPKKSNALKENQNISNISTGVETPISD